MTEAEVAVRYIGAIYLGDTLIELAILGLLKQKPMHGYELKKELTAQLGQFWQASWGSLYPALSRLEKQEAVERIFPKEDVKRRKNIYRITKHGEKLFQNSLSEHSAISDAAGFGLKLAFFRYMKPDARVDLLERRRAYLKEKLAETREKLRAYKERIDQYTYTLMEHDVDVTTADIAWIERLITEEKAHS